MAAAQRRHINTSLCHFKLLLIVFILLNRKLHYIIFVVVKGVIHNLSIHGGIQLIVFYIRILLLLFCLLFLIIFIRHKFVADFVAVICVSIF